MDIDVFGQSNIRDSLRKAIPSKLKELDGINNRVEALDLEEKEENSKMTFYSDKADWLQLHWANFDIETDFAENIILVAAQRVTDWLWNKIAYRDNIGNSFKVFQDQQTGDYYIGMQKLYSTLVMQFVVNNGELTPMLVPYNESDLKHSNIDNFTLANTSVIVQAFYTISRRVRLKCKQEEEYQRNMADWVKIRKDAIYKERMVEVSEMAKFITHHKDALDMEQASLEYLSANN